MPVLELEGMLTTPVPEGRQAFFDDGTSELVPPSGDCAVHVAVHERSPAPVSAEEAHGGLGDLLQSMDAPEGTPVRMVPGQGQFRASARCRTTAPKRGLFGREAG